MFSKLFGWLFPPTSKLPTQKDPSVRDTVEKIHECLNDLCALMPEDQTSNNWRTHFSKMQSVLQQHANQPGIDHVAIMWSNIHGGMGSWNDYYIPHEDHDRMRELNTELEQICSQISALLKNST